MNDLEFVKHRFAGKIKEIIKTYCEYFHNNIIREDDSYLEGYLQGLLYGIGLAIYSITDKGIIHHYIKKPGKNKILAEINFNSGMIEEVSK